ncbi:hypothetical protein AB1Y20_023466 [Prymnesium parvum]|uniref:Uncharacterized protein n=1 Tax=Prymnesium parvum TaxID=97485 RepID=A0AB34JGR8_PRYPA
MRASPAARLRASLPAYARWARLASNASIERREFPHTSSLEESPTPSLTRAVAAEIFRLPTVLFPSQALTLCVARRDAPPPAAPNFTLSREAALAAWKEHGGHIAVLGPGGTHVGVDARVDIDETHSPPDVAHAAGARRLRLVRTSPAPPGAPLRTGVFEPIHDQAVLSERRVERLLAEADDARTLLARGLQAGHLSLESSVRDEELGPPNWPPSAHPLHEQEQQMPDDPAALSLWLAARLPLTTSLRVTLLSCCCALKRMQNVVDGLRLLNEPHRLRFGHRFRLIVSTPATDNCSTVGAQEMPRYVVGEALPPYTSWTDENSFPHG